jgi:hypothetical protein
MMDQERTEKELQEIFEEIQHSYRTLVDNAFTLQEQTLELARTLFESSAQEKSHHIQAELEELANQSRSQREESEKLLRKSSEAYIKCSTLPLTSTTRSKRPKQISRRQAPPKRGFRTGLVPWA